MSEKRRYSLFPKTLANCVEPLTRPVFKERGLNHSRLITDWEHIVGSRLAELCYPEKCSFPHNQKTNGTLTIAVQNGFATELHYLQPLILEKLAAYFGYRAIIRIAISHNFVEFSQKRQAKLRSVSSREMLTVEQTIDDPELKLALESLANTLSKKSE